MKIISVTSSQAKVKPETKEREIYCWEYTTFGGEVKGNLRFMI